MYYIIRLYSVWFNSTKKYFFKQHILKPFLKKVLYLFGLQSFLTRNHFILNHIKLDHEKFDHFKLNHI